MSSIFFVDIYLPIIDLIFLVSMKQQDSPMSNFYSSYLYRFCLLLTTIGFIIIGELMGMNCLDVRALYHRQTAVNISLKRFKNITANSFVSKVRQEVSNFVAFLSGATPAYAQVA